MSISETVKKPNSQKDNQVIGFEPIGETKEFFDEMKAKDNQVISESWEERLVRIIAEKHGGGLGLCDTMFHKTITPFIRELLQSEKDRLIEKLKAKKAKEVSDKLVDEVGKQMIRDGLRHVIGGVYNNALKDAIDVVRSS